MSVLPDVQADGGPIAEETSEELPQSGKTYPFYAPYFGHCCLGWSSDVGLLTVADVASLAAYCQAYGHWRTAEEALARMADRDEHMHGLLIKTVDGNPRRNPLVKVAADAAEDMLRFAGEFGLTPVARTRLAAGGYAQPSPPSKFEGLLH